MKWVCSLSFFLFISAGFYAQDSLKAVKRIRINDIGAQLNLFTGAQNYTDLTDFRAMAPQSILLKDDFSRYKSHTGQSMFSDISSDPVLSIVAGFKFSNKSKTGYRKNIRLKAGFTLYNQQVLAEYNYTQTKPYDVLTSSATGNVVTLDSVIYKSYNMTYSSHQIRLDVAFLWSTNQDKHRMAFYTGLGISAGISFNSTTSVNYGSYSQLKISGQGEQYTNYAHGTGTYTNEEFKNKNDYGIAVYIPLGADLILGRKRRFWRNAHVYYEIKPCYNALKVPGIRDFGSLGILHGWGLRFTI